MLTSWVRPAPSRLWLQCRRHAVRTFYHTSAFRNAGTTNGAKTDDLRAPRDNKKVFRGGNNTSELAVQQLGQTRGGRDKGAVWTKATWEHVSDRTFIDLNPGLGGFHYAFRRHGFRLLCAVEEDAENAKVYKQNFRGAKVKPLGLSSGVLPHCASVLCLPCRGTDGQELFRVLDLVASKTTPRRPLILVVEHAASFATIDQDRKPTGEFARLQERLTAMGYALQWRIYDTSRFGLPLHRERLFMVAVKESYSRVPFEFPKSPFTPGQANEITVRSILETQPSVSLEDLVCKGPGTVFMRETHEVGRKVVRMGHYLGPDRQDKRERHLIFSDMGHVPPIEPNAPFFIQTLGSGNQNVQPNPPDSGGLRLPLEHDQEGRLMTIRRLTPRELARLYGFSDDMHLWTEQHLAWEHISYSVSPPIAEALASAIVVQYFTGPPRRPKAYWDGAKDANLPLMNDLLKRLEGEVQLLKRDLSLAKEQVIGHNIELRELRGRLEQLQKGKT